MTQRKFHPKLVFKVFVVTMFFVNVVSLSAALSFNGTHAAINIAAGLFGVAVTGWIGYKTFVTNLSSRAAFEFACGALSCLAVVALLAYIAAHA